MTKPIVVKLGGRSLEADGAHEELARELRGFVGPTVLVHGGGREVSDWCAKLGIESRFASGLRVTDEATLDVVVAVLAGLANQRLVARLRAAGIDAAGVSLADGGIGDVTHHPERATLGAVGAVHSVRTDLLVALLDRGMTPVVSSIGAHDGALLNVNADDAAAAIAAALAAQTLVMLSDVEGVVLDGRPVATLALDDVDGGIARGEITGGMLPKLAAARHALDGGCSQVVIGAWKGPGTLSRMISPIASNPPAGTSILAAAQPHERKVQHV